MNNEPLNRGSSETLNNFNVQKGNNSFLSVIGKLLGFTVVGFFYVYLFIMSSMSVAGCGAGECIFYFLYGVQITILWMAINFIGMVILGFSKTLSRKKFLVCIFNPLTMIVGLFILNYFFLSLP